MSNFTDEQIKSIVQYVHERTKSRSGGRFIVDAADLFEQAHEAARQGYLIGEGCYFTTTPKGVALVEGK